MTHHEIKALKIGTIYFVRHRNNDKTFSRRTRRVYKGIESRFGELPCCVFSSRLPIKATVEVDGDNLIYSHHVPTGEISIPLYDLVEVKGVEK